MRVTGIIAEYNPLHKGHLHHIEQTKALLHPDVLIVIVSSYFSQRALPSLLSPKDKAALALQAGADLVLELPAVYAAQSADKFALYSLEALKCAGADSICFGSETHDIQKLQKYASLLESFEKDPATSMSRHTADLLEPLGANDILGIQYVRWCREFGITPYTILRSPDYKSATATRKDFFENRPQFLDEHFLKEQCWDSYYPYLRLFLQMSDPAMLKNCFLVTEGIEHRLVRLARTCRSWPEFLEAAITKTYTRARIQRTCLFLLLQITKKQMEDHSSFFALRLLGMNSKGQAYLKSLPAGTPVYSRFRDLPPFLKEAERKSKALYCSVMKEPLEEGIVIL